jgi:hypothetical protein
MIQHISEEQHKKEVIGDQKEQIQSTFKDSMTSSLDLKSKVQSLTKKQKQLQDKILHISIGNGMRQNDKETIMILLLSIVKHLRGLKMHRDSIKQSLA